MAYNKLSFHRELEDSKADINYRHRLVHAKITVKKGEAIIKRREKGYATFIRVYNVFD